MEREELATPFSREGVEGGVLGWWWEEEEDRVG